MDTSGGRGTGDGEDKEEAYGERETEGEEKEAAYVLMLSNTLSGIAHHSSSSHPGLSSPTLLQ